jgi:hypothetical protein
MIAKAKAEGKRYKLVCSAEKVGEKLKPAFPRNWWTRLRRSTA